MKLKTKIACLFFWLISSFAYGQMEQYEYKRELSGFSNGFSNQWYKISLPEEMFSKILPSFDDIRVFGITSNNDTIEAPFLLESSIEEVSKKETASKIINTAKKNNEYYFGFEIPNAEAINLIRLDFKEKNYDWKVKLEASQNQKDWFTILKNYRILSINNAITDFQFATLAFPSAKYRFYRLQIESKAQPELSSVGIAQQEITEAKYRNYPIQHFKIIDKKASKQTEIDIELLMPVPISFLSLDIKNTYDYYRPIAIQYLSDSFKTEKGWQYNYNNLTSGTLHSIDKKGFTFNSTIAKKLKIIIENNDNQPLSILSAQVKGYDYDLKLRVDKEATYYLTYGNNTAKSPVYDMEHFADKVPFELTMLKIGNEQLIEKKDRPTIQPLFKN